MIWFILADLAGVALCLLGAAFCLASILPKWGGGSASEDAQAMVIGIVLAIVGFGVLIAAGVWL